MQPLDDSRFILDGFVRLPHAFSPQTAEAARAILWRDTGCAPGDPATWTRPVVRLGMYGQPPFVEAANTPRLHAAFDTLVGRSNRPSAWRCAADSGNARPSGVAASPPPGAPTPPAACDYCSW